MLLSHNEYYFAPYQYCLWNMSECQTAKVDTEEIMGDKNNTIKQYSAGAYNSASLAHGSNKNAMLRRLTHVYQA